MARRGVLAAASAAITLLSVLAAAPPVAATSESSGSHHKRVCAEKSGASAACQAQVVTDANLLPLATTTYGGNGYSPTQLRTAYGLSTGSAPTVAIVDAYANPNAASDVLSIALSWASAPPA